MKPAHSIVILASIVLIMLASGCAQQPATGNVAYPAYTVADGKISYADRPTPEYTKSFFNETLHATIHRIAYRSRGAAIYGLLAVPKTGNNRPAFVLLPAQGIKKEVEQQWLGDKLNSMGFITLSLDQRGHGETTAQPVSMQEDFKTYAQGGETVQSKMVYDALAAYDILKSMPEVDPFEIYMAGESMGGRHAVIAASVEPGIAGLLLISTAGYGLPESGFENLQEFQRFTDPDSYVDRISPRKILMIHSPQDWIIPIESARNTFSLAREPKRFITVDERFHGYYNVIGFDLPEILEDNINEWLLK